MVSIYRIEVSCVLAAALFAVSHLLSLIANSLSVRHHTFDWERWTALDVEYIQDRFDLQSKLRGLHFTFGILNALGWVVLAIPVLQVAWLLSSGPIVVVPFGTLGRPGVIASGALCTCG